MTTLDEVQKALETDVVQIRIDDIKQGIARAKTALVDGEYRLIDIWLLTLATQIKSLEHAYGTLLSDYRAKEGWQPIETAPALISEDKGV